MNCICKINLKKNIKFIIILNIAAIEEYFNILTIKSHENNKITHNGQDVTNKRPIKLATPFPPLNLSQTGKICPNMEKNPLIIPTSMPK